MSRSRVLACSCVVAAPLDEVFGFFAQPANLDELTPPWLRFRLETDPLPAMRVGAFLDYRLRVRGLPLRWRSEITTWEPPVRFVDEQRRGPYRRWHHEHRFRQLDAGTEIADRVEYRVPGGLLEPILHRWLVAPDLRRIFAFRQRRVLERFGHPRRPLG